MPTRPRRPRRRAILPAAAALSFALLAGCGTADDRTQAEDVVARFSAALDAGRGDDACALLSDATAAQLEQTEQKPCAEAVTSLPHEPGAVANAEVYITNAKIDLDSGETMFLSREADGWKLSAVACTPADGKPADRPYECEVEA